MLFPNYCSAENKIHLTAHLRSDVHLPQVSVASTGLGGQQFWELLRDSNLESEARNFYAEARAILPKKGGSILQVNLYRFSLPAAI